MTTAALDAPARTEGRPFVVLFVVSAAVFLVSLDLFIVNIDNARRNSPELLGEIPQFGAVCESSGLRL